MKKLFTILLFVFVSVIPTSFIFAYGGQAPQTAVGSITYYGNAPFAFPGLQTVDGYLYTLAVEENAPFTLKDIEAAQGNLIEFTGTIDKSQKNGLNVLKDGIFIVSEWKILNGEEKK